MRQEIAADISCRNKTDMLLSFFQHDHTRDTDDINNIVSNKLDGTRRAAVDGCASACCDLDL